jgi:hypothetical protein
MARNQAVGNPPWRVLGSPDCRTADVEVSCVLLEMTVVNTDCVENLGANYRPEFS